MKHLTEQELALHYYGETGTDAEQHLGDCESCRAAYQTLQRVLNSIDSFPVPDRSADYETQVWQAIQHGMPKRVKLWVSWRTLAAAAVAAALIIGAFFAGRSSKKQESQIAADPQVRERVLLVAVGDHLERSRMVLIELANAGVAKSGSLDISDEQRAAQDLIESNRLYRATAASDGDVATAALLEELERVLLEIAHSPTAVSEKQLDDLRREINDRGILFKVKVFGTQVEQRETSMQNGSGL